MGGAWPAALHGSRIESRMTVLIFSAYQATFPGKAVFDFANLMARRLLKWRNMPGQIQGLRVKLSLNGAEVLSATFDDFQVILFGYCDKSDIPCAFHALAIAFTASDFRCVARDSEELKVAYLPAALSARPT
jgi:hypothetical protein